MKNIRALRPLTRFMSRDQQIECVAERHEHRAEQLRRDPEHIDPHWSALPMWARIDGHEDNAKRLRKLLE